MTDFEKGFLKAATMPHNPSTTRSLVKNTFVEKGQFNRGLPKPLANVSVRQTIKQTKAISPMPSVKSPFGMKQAAANYGAPKAPTVPKVMKPTQPIKPMKPTMPSVVGGKKNFIGTSIGGGTGMKGGSSMLGGKPKTTAPIKPPSPF